MNSYQGFWSYAQKDDEAEQGRISRLARDVVAQYEMLTGEKIELFLDKDSLAWGDNLHDKIDESLASVAFFIPVITPRYFMRIECRRELQFFAQRANRLGIQELVLPLHYVDVPTLQEDQARDDLIDLICKFKWEDWREVRFEDVTAAVYRRRVAELANRLVAANRSAEEANIADAALQLQIERDTVISKYDISLVEDDMPGFIDRIAKAEEILPNWNVTLINLTQEVEAIGIIMNEAASKIQNELGFAHRLLVARQLAQRLSEPTEKISTLGHEFISQLHDIDDGFHAIIERATAEIQDSPESKQGICQFFEMIKNLSMSANQGLTSTQDMLDSIAPIEKMSRDLRPVLRQLRQSLTILLEAREVTDNWNDLIDASGVDCQSLENEEA